MTREMIALFMLIRLTHTAAETYQMLMIRTDDVLAPHHLMELFTTSDDEYDGPDLDECDGVIQVCEGEWRLEYDGPDAGLWRFWKWPEDAQ